MSENEKQKIFYLLGVGGIGMSAIARFLLHQGHIVLGYDRVQTPLTLQLQQEGVQITYEDNIKHLPEKIDTCIYTPAIPENNNIFQEILHRNIPMEKRSEALGHITKDKKVLAVAGTHGKTTTTGLITHILSLSPIGCSAFLGGIQNNINSNFLFNAQSPYVVVEADEYDRSFLHLKPFISVITSIDRDHMDIYHTYENLHNAFESFARLTDKNGKVIVKTTCQNLIEKLQGKENLYTYSLMDVNAQTYASNIRIYKGSFYFDYIDGEDSLFDVQLNTLGNHNVENSVAAIKVCNSVMKAENISKPQRETILRNGLKSFKGIKRRLEYIYSDNNVIFIDDYAHHPNEILSSLEAIRQAYPNKHLTVIFQPHLYSRTRDLQDGFAQSLSLADTIILLPIYPAREEPIAGVSSHLILHKIPIMDKYLVNKEQLQPLLSALEPELIVTMGAGDIDKLLPIIKETLLNKRRI